MKEKMHIVTIHESGKFHSQLITASESDALDHLSDQMSPIGMNRSITDPSDIDKGIVSCWQSNDKKTIATCNFSPKTERS